MAICQRRFQSDVRDDVFEDHYKAFQFPTADEPVVHVVEGFDLQSWAHREGCTALDRFWHLTWRGRSIAGSLQGTRPGVKVACTIAGNRLDWNDLMLHFRIRGTIDGG